MKHAILALCLVLGGCTGLQAVIAPPYVPEPIHIYDQAQYAADVLECSAAGANFKPQFSLRTIITKSVQGATSNTSMIPLSPLVPAYGAAGGALGAASDGLDVMSGQHAAVYQNCLRDELHNDHAAVLVDTRE